MVSFYDANRKDLAYLGYTGTPRTHLHQRPCSLVSGSRNGKDRLARRFFWVLRDCAWYRVTAYLYLLILLMRDQAASPLISTIAEPVEPNGLAGFSLCSTAGRDVGGVDDMPIRDRYPFSTEWRDAFLFKYYLHLSFPISLDCPPGA